MGMMAILTADDLPEINRELARGNDVEIRRTADGLAIKAHTVHTVKKKKGTTLPMPTDRWGGESPCDSGERKRRMRLL